MTDDLQQVAEKWAEATDRLAELNDKLGHLENEILKVETFRDQCGNRLKERVGNNIPRRVFKVGAQAVLVDHQLGVLRIKIENEEK